MARYRTIEIEPGSVTTDADGHQSAIGTVQCYDANPATTGPNYVPSVRLRGRLIRVRGTEAWLPTEQAERID